jgi:hypothetical protein
VFHPVESFDEIVVGSALQTPGIWVEAADNVTIADDPAFEGVPLVVRG